VLGATANDNFADALVISALPFSSFVDVTDATSESGEPQPCGYVPRTVWYTITPATSGSLTANLAGPTDATLGVYLATGSGLLGLTPLNCVAYGGSVTFSVQAGSTYYFQAGLFYGTGSLHLSVEVASDPVAGICYDPIDPSEFDEVLFVDCSVDPMAIGFAAWAWDFGDGTTSTAPAVTHTFAKEGDYTVRLAVTTSDGRTASTTQVVSVRTHDVAITKFTVPAAASAGQTRLITVGVSNRRYPETVQVQLFRSSPAGFDLVGTLTQSVPVRAAGRTTSFVFSYTFTMADAALGKVTFKAEATIQGRRDALPADNTAITLPTKILK
jgi:PKD repeat protein